MLLVSLRRAPAVGDLSPRELQVAELLGRGLTPKEIGGRLQLSTWTVRDHLERARLRLGARTNHELVALLARSRARNGGRTETTPSD